MAKPIKWVEVARRGRNHAVLWTDITACAYRDSVVIGTKIATKVLKDGDRVEVDATRGIVRKL